MDERGPVAHVDETNREQYDPFQQMNLDWELKLIMRIEPAFRALSELGLDYSHAIAMIDEEVVVLFSNNTKSYIRIGFVL